MESTKKPSAWASTTHAENTQENGLTLCVDWVTASFRTALDMQQIMQYFGVVQLENMEEIPGARYGFAGYDYTYRLGSIDLMHKSDSEEWLINMSGQGCREYELLSGYDFELFFALMVNFYPTYTRLDLAIDDFKNIFNVQTMRNAVRNGQVVSRLKEYGSHVRGLIARPDKLTMDNFYLGSKSSRYFINVYDKKLERQNKDLKVVHDTWTRTEVRFKNEYAVQMVDNILKSPETIGDNLFAFLNQNVAILKPTVAATTKNRARDAQNVDKQVRWWRQFLNTTKKLKLTVYKPDLPLLASKTWLLDKVSTTLTLFKMYYTEQEFRVFLHELSKVGFEKMDKRHLKRLEQQIMLDDAIQANRPQDAKWFETVHDPSARKVALFSLVPEAKRTAKEKEEYKEMLLGHYWNKVAEQQKRAHDNDEIGQ